MKPFSWLAIFALALLIMSTANADVSDAILRCDPATEIRKIDGDSKRAYSAGFGQTFRECAIPLSPGSHKLEVCYDNEGSAGYLYAYTVCKPNFEVTIDAKPGRTYRLKLDFHAPWKAWVEDVTESEADLSYEEPPKKPKPSGSKKDLETYLVLRATPEHAVLMLQRGVIRGKWFDPFMTGLPKLLGFSRKGVPDGYHVFRAQGGDTLAFVAGQMMTGKVLEIKQVNSCGDFPARVYENIPPGKVLYIGHYTIQDAPGGYVGSYRDDDLAEARTYIDSHHPELAGRLEAAPFRTALTPNLCRFTGFDLRTEGQAP
jgi:hypothetical protein